MSNEQDDLDKELEGIPMFNVEINEPSAYDGSDTDWRDIDEMGLIAKPDIQTDLFGEAVAQPEPSFSATTAIMGEDIIKIRALNSGTKARKNADEALRAATVAFLNDAPADAFWVPGNVPSSKNSKDIITVKRMTKQGMREFSVPIPSKLVKEYIRDSKGHWLQNKVAFLNQVRHQPLPLFIEFTFIRESLRRFDFVNAAHLLLDLMANKEYGYGYLEDDDSVNIVPIFNKVVYYHSDMPGVLIRILK